MTKRPFIIYSYYGEILDLALHLKNRGNEVYVYIQSDEYKHIGDGMVEKVENWFECLGKGYIWVFDGCENGKLQDWLRSQGEDVMGGNEKADKLENERQLGQEWFKRAGFKQPESKNFKSIEDALTFVKENKDRRWILKQNGSAPKSINHMGKFKGSEDMMYHLEQLKTKWNDSEFGAFDCDIMEIVDGMEVAASVFFNGKDFLKNKEGKVVGFLNWEEKKEGNGNTGITCGEMGTTFLGVDESNDLFADIMMRPEIKKVLQKINFRGVFDINGCLTEEGYVAFEPTCRFGVPATSYEFIEGMENPEAVITALATGKETECKIKMGYGMVMVVVAKPFPVEADLDPTATSMGEKLWILNGGSPIKDFSDEQKKHIHLYNFQKKDNDYIVVAKNGYLLTVTGSGKTIAQTRDKLIQYIKDNLYISDMKYRTDIGARVEDY